MFRELAGNVKKSFGFSTVDPADWLREFNTAVAASSGIRAFSDQVASYPAAAK